MIEKEKSQPRKSEIDFQKKESEWDAFQQKYYEDLQKLRSAQFSLVVKEETLESDYEKKREQFFIICLFNF